MNKLDNDLLNSVKAKQRLEEISKYGKVISLRSSVVKNKKRYSRKLKHRSQKFDSY